MSKLNAFVRGCVRACIPACIMNQCALTTFVCPDTPHRGAADADIKVPSVEKPELEGFPFKAWCRSVYSHTCYAYCQGFLPC